MEQIATKVLTDTTVAKTATGIFSQDPSLKMMVIVLTIATVYLIVSLSKNTTITKFIFAKLDKSDEMAATVAAIRADQLESNKERKILASDVKTLTEDMAAIKNRMAHVETTVADKVCKSAPNCQNRSF